MPKYKHDDLNPNFMFQTIDTGLLLDAMFEIIDLKGNAKQELINRGLDYSGEYIGFKRAKEYWDSFDLKANDFTMTHEKGVKSMEQLLRDALKTIEENKK